MRKPSRRAVLERKHRPAPWLLIGNLVEAIIMEFWAIFVLLGVVFITIMGAIGLWGSTSSEGDSPASQEHK